MFICPVCEHPQAQGSECEVCGKLLVPARRLDVPVARMAELEQTQLPAAPALPASPFPELDVHRAQAAPDLPPLPVPELDRGRAGNLAVPIERMADLDPHGLPADPSERTAPPTGAVTCRYCRNVQAEGLLCDRCGMRLPRYVPAAAANPAAPLAEAPMVRHGCGVKTRANEPCSSCGVFVPLPE